MSSALLAEAIGERATYCGGIADTAHALRKELRAGDLAIVLGAGDIYKVFEVL